MEDEINTTAELHEASALPCAGVSHTEPQRVPTAEQRPMPEELTRKPIADKSPAEWAYERVILYIRAFEEQLDTAHEVAIGLVGGNAGVLRIEGVGYFDPDIVTFYGSDESGAKTQLIQHVNQLSVILRAIPKETNASPARRIGFALFEDMSGGESDAESVVSKA